MDLGFPTGQDFLVPQDKGTMRQAQNLATSRARTQDRREKKNHNFLANQVVILSLDVPGQRSLSRDFSSCPCPGTKGQGDKDSFFSQDKRTMLETLDGSQ